MTLFYIKQTETPTKSSVNTGIKSRKNTTAFNVIKQIDKTMKIAVVYTSALSGYVTPPGYDGETSLSLINCLLRGRELWGPSGHVIMISFWKLDLLSSPHTNFLKTDSLSKLEHAATTRTDICKMSFVSSGSFCWNAEPRNL